MCPMACQLLALWSNCDFPRNLTSCGLERLCKFFIIYIFSIFYFYLRSRTTHYFTYVSNLGAFGSSHPCGQDLFDLITVKFCEWIKLETSVFPDCSHASCPANLFLLYLYLFPANLQATDISLFTYLFLLNYTALSGVWFMIQNSKGQRGPAKTIPLI